MAVDGTRRDGVLQAGGGRQGGLGSAALSPRRRRIHWRRAFIPYLFISPFIAFFLIFNIYPDGYSLVLSFYRYRGYGTMRYIGWDNYSAILHYHVFWTEFENTIFYWLAHAIPLIPLSFLLALLVRSRLIKGQRFIRPIIFLPQVIAIVAATLVFQNLFSTQYGAINSIFHTKVEWLQNFDIARWVIVILLIWRGLGFWFVVFLAGLTSINPELEEAAIMDGASTWARTMFVIVPLMRNVFLFAFVIDAINSMSLFTEPNILTAGPNMADPQVAPMLNLLVTNLNDGDFGQSAATGWILFAVTLDHFDRAVRVVPQYRGGRLMSASAPPLQSNARYRATRRLQAGIAYLIVAVVLVFSLYPPLMMVINSFKSNNEVNINPGGLPQHWTVAGYQALATTNGNQFYNFWNSVVISVSTTVVSVFVGALAGYAFAKYRFWGRNVIFFALLATLMVPQQITLPPLYLMFSQINWIDTLQVQIVPFFASVFGLFLIRQYMQTIPDALLEAARIDGAGDWGLFWRIVLPVSAPVLGVFAILQFLFTWNNYLWPTVMANTPNVAPISFTLPTIRDPIVGFLPAYGTIMAGCVLATLPILIVFLLNQEKFMTGVVVGSIKE